MTDYNVGDTVRYTGNTEGKPMNDKYMGLVGTVTRVYLTGEVDTNFPGHPYLAPKTHNLSKVVTDQAAINAALEVLSMAGVVTFKQHKPPFAPVRISGIGSHTAVVTQDRVTVGCTVVTFDKIDEVYRATQAARQSTAE